MQKIRKLLRAFSEKTALPTNQPTNYYQQQDLADASPKHILKIFRRDAFFSYLYKTLFTFFSI